VDEEGNGGSEGETSTGFLFLWSFSEEGTRRMNRLIAYFAFLLWRDEGSFLELELIQTQMTEKPMLWEEVYPRALRASHYRKEDSL
jgi:hypothetical protein